MYTYDGFNSVGEAEHSTGTLDGDTWTWTADERMGDTVMKGRFTMKILTPTSYSFKYEMSRHQLELDDGRHRNQDQIVRSKSVQTSGAHDLPSKGLLIEPDGALDVVCGISK